MPASIIAAKTQIFDSAVLLCAWLNANPVNSILQIVCNNDGKFTLFYT